MADMDGNENRDASPRRNESKTDRVNGEFHYKNGYTQKIYSDAHYVKEEDDTVPPKYYTPPEKAVKEPKPRRPRPSAAMLICLCLACAILGGLTGAGIVGRKLKGQVDELTLRLDSVQEEPEIQDTFTPEEDPGMSVTPGSIYDSALETVVSVVSLKKDGTVDTVYGSGFVISDDGYIITNRHVFAAAVNAGQDIGVLFSDGELITAEVIGDSSEDDLTVLRVLRTDLVPVVTADSDSVYVGDRVFAVGSALGQDGLCLSSGCISSPARLIETDSSDISMAMFQFDAPVNSGNSGGPLFNDKGQVIGVVTAKYTAMGVEGMAFAIPFNEAVSIANDLITKGYVSGKAYLGVEPDLRYCDMYSQYFGLPMGAYVNRVAPGSAAEAAGLQAGDIIIKVGDMDVSDCGDLSKAIRRYSAGDSAEIRFFRSGVTFYAQPTFGEVNPDIQLKGSF